MAITDIWEGFEALKLIRRTVPEQVLIKIGDVAFEAVSALSTANSHSIIWRGGGQKDYRVFSVVADNSSWSRAINTQLFIEDPKTFRIAFDDFIECIISDRGNMVVNQITREQIDRVMYTTVLSFSAIAGLYNLGRVLAGTFFEMAVGVVISLLTGRPETSEIVLPVPGTKEIETIKVDLSFHSTSGGVSLVVPTKISTRERISQAYVHAKILNTARPGRYRNILCAVNEVNAFHFKNAPKNIGSLYLDDTLVPGTIVLYQRYLAPLDALYYLDPPERYLSGDLAGMPPVRRFGTLLLGDLVELLA
jgi:hypothetical protein